MKPTLRLVLMALFLGIGTVLYAIIPGFVMGMKPDMLLSAMFLSIFFLADRRTIIILGLVTGVLSGLFSTMPGGFLPNVIDKLITSLIIFGLFMAFKKVIHSFLGAAILTVVGTIVSGTVFLSALGLIATLPKSFFALFTAVVLPAALINAVFMAIVYPIVAGIMVRSGHRSSNPKITA
ncbi:tryptophan transporter [Pullulanibacillus sp. KACC 23026]|uniref:tryptophan transporter n=1 Tax=Pullulanibacillus sp. KACC 23026 TaxID=3028315 RepID=UPI0023B1A409|nr:tryptophan transporter [Pullulanibacillus sp. KACC 23026]WEG12028.1 tryptophan transporter [Pullulanibacillus sp. KACC 23026]